ncbi:hypothetical protein HZH66_003225 [Vespula vulgaris]|uniref:Uncharacterized protein n=1 Tax=Vespula vulgaris TaxID=7454 RepID=A0A834KL24_VESVU|nr:hypothetical protein HZH66_003225 [Vespula vulgaris]
MKAFRSLSFSIAWQLDSGNFSIEIHKCLWSEKARSWHEPDGNGSTWDNAEERRRKWDDGWVGWLEDEGWRTMVLLAGRPGSSIENRGDTSEKGEEQEEGKVERKDGTREKEGRKARPGPKAGELSRLTLKEKEG